MEERPEGERRGRALTDEDAKAIAAALADEMEDRLIKRFYHNLGRGLWGLLWKGFLLAMLGLAAYGGIQKLPH